MTMNGSENLAVEVDGLTRRFGQLTAVDNLSLNLPTGTVLGFIGQNGAGKTTTIRMLMGLCVRDAGRVSVLGVDPGVDDLLVKRRVGYVPEQHFISRWMRAREAIDFCRSVYPTWNDKTCASLMTLFGIDPNKKVRQLSKGTVVKLALVLALSHEPELLILDEPMAGLDPVAREELLDGVLQTVCDGNRTILFSSHTLSDVQRLADTIAMIDEGRLLIHCGVDELLRGTKRIRAILADGVAPGCPPEGTIRQRVQDREWLVTVRGFSPDTLEQLRATSRVEHVEVIDMGLEEIFKDLVRGRRESE